VSVHLAGPSAAALGPATVHLWTAWLTIDDERVAELWPLLSPDERERARRFVFPRDRRSFVAARGYLRHLLAAYVGDDPASLRFAYGDRGKPALDPRHHSRRLEFNLSHAGGLAAIAVSSGSPVGVDVEQIRALDDLECLARQCFAPGERAELLQLASNAREQAFFNCWTRKEAYIKALGEGLSCPLESFEVSLTPGDRAELRSIDARADLAHEWWMHAFVPAPGFAGAIVARRPCHGVTCGWIDADAVPYPVPAPAMA
jgi:4'-phosphopantetheinyl transferase